MPKLKNGLARRALLGLTSPGSRAMDARAGFGFPPCRRAEAPPPSPEGVRAVRLEGVHEEPIDFAGREGTCMVTVCTRNYLFLARALVESWRRHHPGAGAFVLVVDWDGEEPLAIEGANLLAGPRLAIPGFDYLALKYTASEMCCAVKPRVLDHVLRHTRCRKLVYLDSDLYLFAPLTRMLAALDRHDFVVTPHTLAPMPSPERFWERPTLGDLAFAGPFNAGMFGVRATPGADAFLTTWWGLVSQPGAFMTELGGQAEQNSFNWVSCFAGDVEVLRDPAYNVAYWNLHDRSLRWAGFDDPDDDAEDSWTVDGEALVAYHFSGFSPAAPWKLSRYDLRHSLYTLPSLARLTDFYAARLREHGSEEEAKRAYRFDTFPSGIAIDLRMRRVFKEHESFLAVDLSPWTPEGETWYCEALLSPIPYTGSLLPALFDSIYPGRPDLLQVYPGARLRPEGMLRWISSYGVYEYGYRELYDRWRPVLPSHHGAVTLTRALRETPRMFAGLASPMGADRYHLLDRLEDAGLAALAGAVRGAELEHYYVSPVWMIRRIVEERPDVRRAFPDLLYVDAPAFARWLTEHGAEDHFLPAHAPAVFAAKAGGRALARVFSYLSRRWDLMQGWPLGLVGERSEELAFHLLAATRNGMEYDLDDVLFFLWTMEVKPWAGLALTFELGANACRTPSPLLPDGQEQLLGALLHRDLRFREALARYREEHRGERFRLQEEGARRIQEARHGGITVFDALERASGGPRREGPRRAGPHPAGDAVLETPGPGSSARLLRGVNLFGFHKSPIGLGSLTRGLGMALAEAGIPVAASVMGNVAMDADLSPKDFVRTYDPRLDTNVFASYPHLHEMLLEGQPEHVTRGRRNVIYLAWEQRDGSHYWPEVYGEFDQVWALSDFAAESLRRFMRREVHTVPCVLDFGAFPEPASKQDFGLDPDRLTFLYVFDANSSIERKNPEAVIHAFASAFAPGEPVCLLLRVSNAHRLHHKERLKRMLGAARPGLEVRLVTEPLAHADLLRLVSAADCYVSLHRAEGFGYTCAEAMAYGKPVIATAYSGNLEFMTRENSFLVDYRETGVEVADGPFQRGSVWAEPDVAHAAHLMRSVYRNREAARLVGERARRDVREQLSAAAVGKIAAAALGRREPPPRPSLVNPAAAAGDPPASARISYAARFGSRRR